MNAGIEWNKGSNPDINTRNNNPRLRNMYVSSTGTLERSPSLEVISSIDGVVAVKKTNYKQGAYLVATSGQLLRVDSSGSTAPLMKINTSGDPVRIDENVQNQVIVTTGANAYVFNQRTGLKTTLGANEGFALTNPIDVIVINTFAIIIGGTDKQWYVSNADNAISFDSNNIKETDESLGDLVGCAQEDNNLFIFGKYGIQRWQPSIERTQYDFPFTQDSDFKVKTGALSTSSIQSNESGTYFLASNFSICALMQQSIVSLSSPGITKEISSYQKQYFSKGSVYHHDGHYFYQISFPDDGNSWTYCFESKTFSESDDIIIAATDSLIDGFSVVAVDSGINSLVPPNDYSLCLWQSEVQLVNNDTGSERQALSSIKLDMTQGLSQSPSPQKIELQVSLDNLRWSNVITRDIGKVGKTRQSIVWRMNVLSDQFTYRIRYYGNLDVSFRRIIVNIN